MINAYPTVISFSELFSKSLSTETSVSQIYESGFSSFEIWSFVALFIEIHNIAMMSKF